MNFFTTTTGAHVFKKIACLAILAAAPLFAGASDLPDYPFIHASGVGFAYVIPDIGELDFEILAVDADPEAARQVVESRIAQLRALADGLGLGPDALEIRDVRKEIRKGDSRADGVVYYNLKCGVHIKVKDLTKWPALVLPLIDMPNLDAFSTEFGVADRDKVEMDLMNEAIKAARKRGEGMAAGFGKKLGPVTGVTSGQLANLTRAMGLSPADRFNRGSSSSAQSVDKRDMLLVTVLKWSQAVDVIFKIGK
jgi:uncharacterized protein